MSLTAVERVVEIIVAVHSSTICTFLPVAAEEVTLGLGQVGGKPRAPVRVEVVERSRERRARNTAREGQGDHSPPAEGQVAQGSNTPRVWDIHGTVH